ncbi:DNA primase [Vibrio phage EniLVp02]
MAKSRQCLNFVMITTNDRDMDVRYARQAMPRLAMSEVTSTNPFRVTFRCPVCGDSKKDRLARRGWIYEGNRGKTRGVILFNCFNCDNGGHGAIPLGLFLKQHFPYIHEQYEQERRQARPKRYESDDLPSKQGKSLNEIIAAEKAAQEAREKILSEDKLLATKVYATIRMLPDKHPVKRYVKMRQIPEKHWDILGYTPGWYALLVKLGVKEYSDYVLENYDHPRLVIPIFNKDGLIGVQGRALNKDRTPRYQTIKVDDSFGKIYGLERIDPSYPVTYVEGPIDSLFLTNCGAITGGFSNPDLVPYPSVRRFALDNEPRSKDTISRMQNLIAAGERIVIWDKLPLKIQQYKDVNDMVQKGGCPASFIDGYINDNTLTGVEAQARFDRWKRI